MTKFKKKWSVANLVWGIRNIRIKIITLLMMVYCTGAVADCPLSTQNDPTQCVKSVDYPKMLFKTSNVPLKAGATIPLSLLMSYIPSQNSNVSGAVIYFDVYPTDGYTIQANTTKSDGSTGVIEYVLQLSPGWVDAQYVATGGDAPWNSANIVLTTDRSAITLRGFVLLEVTQLFDCLFQSPLLPIGMGYAPDGLTPRVCTLGVPQDGQAYGPQFPFGGAITANAGTAQIVLSGLETVEPSGTTYKAAITTETITATVIDQNNKPIPNSNVTIITKAVDFSGGHCHDPEKKGLICRADQNRPKGTLTISKDILTDGLVASDSVNGVTKSNGQFIFTFTSSPVSGSHEITAMCDQCIGPTTGQIDVKVNKLFALPTSDWYNLNTPDSHPKQPGLFLTGTAAIKLESLAHAYVTSKQEIRPTKPTVNAGSLEWGGLYDINKNWKSPHGEHRRGTVVDLRANLIPGAIPQENFIGFNVLCSIAKARCAIHCRTPKQTIDSCPSDDGVVDSNQHMHIQLMGRDE